MDARARARLVEDNLAVAGKAARMIYKRVSAHMELEELVAIGNAALAEAAERYAPDRGATFATFAWYRVYGAMVDACRKNSMLPRRVWTQLVALRAASEYLEHRAEREQGATARGAPPATGGKALADIQSAIAAIRTMYVVSLEAKRDAGFDPAAPMVNEQERIDLERMGRRIRLALGKLPEKERALMTKHYWEGKNLLDAGVELGISKSWASRLHAQAVERLRALVAEAAPNVDDG